MVEVPAVVRKRGGRRRRRRLAASISDAVADLVSEWDLTVVSAYEEGTEAVLLGVDCADGTQAVLKLLVPRPGGAAHRETSVLRLVDGDGCVRLLAHDEVHQWNALHSDTGWALVDPDGLLAEPEYDLGILMREDPVELLVGDPWDRARFLAERCGCGTTAVWQWGVVERVSTGLACLAVGLDVEGREMLRAADVVAGLAG